MRLTLCSYLHVLVLYFPPPSYCFSSLSMASSAGSVDGLIRLPFAHNSSARVISPRGGDVVTRSYGTFCCGREVLDLPGLGLIREVLPAVMC